MPKIHKLSELNFPEGLSKPARALKIAIASGGLIAKVLAQKAEIREQTLSEFLSGVRSGLRADYLEKLVDNLPAELQDVFFREWRGQSIPEKERSLVEMIDRLDPNNPQDCKQVADALRLIAVRFFPEPPTSQDRDSMENRKTTDESKYLASLQSR